MAAQGMYMPLLMAGLVVLSAGSPATIRLNMVQSKGTHASYHVASGFSIIGNSQRAFTHAPIPTQLDLGVRSLNFDVHFEGSTARVYNEDFDFGTRCSSLDRCIGIASDWSIDHPGHSAIMIHVNVRNMDGQTVAEAIENLENAAFTALGTLSRIVQAGIVNLARKYASLRAATNDIGWPVITDQVVSSTLRVGTRGQFLLAVTFADDVYLSDPTGFANVFNTTELAFALMPSSLVLNEGWAVVQSVTFEEATTNATLMNALFADNVLITCRSDEDLTEFSNATDKLLEAGVNIIETDFPFKTTYSSFSVTLPNGSPSICNPKTSTPAVCLAGDIESGITTEEQQTEGSSDDFWCCQDAPFFWAACLIPAALLLVHWFVYGWCQLHTWAVERCCCCIQYIDDEVHPGTQLVVVRLFGLGFGIQMMCFLTNISLRDGTDFVLMRHSFSPDDFFTAMLQLVRSLLICVALATSFQLYDVSVFVRLTSALGVNFRAFSTKMSPAWWLVHQYVVLTPIVEIAAVIVSAAGGDSQSLSYGDLDSGKAFLPILIVQNILAFLAVGGLVYVIREGKVSPHTCTESAYVAIALLLTGYPQLLLIAIIGNSGNIEPTESITDMPERVVIWYNMILSLELVILAVITHRLFQPRSTGPPPPEVDAGGVPQAWTAGSGAPASATFDPSRARQQAWQNAGKTPTRPQPAPPADSPYLVPMTPMSGGNPHHSTYEEPVSHAAYEEPSVLSPHQKSLSGIYGE